MIERKRDSDVSRFPPRRILIPVDFSDASLAGLSAAKLLWSRWGSQLDVVHVCESFPASLDENKNTPEEKARIDRYCRGIEARLHALLKNFQPSSARLLHGYPKEVIADLAENGEYDWVVMGTHGHGRIKRLILGSVAEAAMHAAHVPVVTVRSTPPPRWPSRILVPLKITGYADRALLFAHRLATTLNANITVMHCASEAESIQEVFSAIEEHVHRLVGDEQPIEMIRASGEPAEAILKVAQSGGFDLIVLSAHRKPFLEGLVLGKTTERVLRYSSVPVLSLPSVAAKINGTRSPILERRVFESLTKHH